jgi:nicotinate phosphoribosyltransferase
VSGIAPGGGRAPGLLVDLYELTMAESYLAEGIAERPATFSLFVRQFPAGWGVLVAAGLERVLEYLETLAFTPEDLAHLEAAGHAGSRLLDRLDALRFTGSVRAVAEGTPILPGEPLLEVTGPLIEAQIAETMVVNHAHLETLLATKAARCVEAAAGRPVIDFSLRRAHGADAAMAAARSSWLAGFAATSNVLAGPLLGMPVAGTMAHSFVQSFPSEADAFAAFVRTHPEGPVLLIDTYDTPRGARVAAEVAATGARLRGVRIDSGDPLTVSREVREILDATGLADVTILASGGLDEHEIARLVAAGAPIDAFAVGSKVGVSADAPYLDMAYKLVQAGRRPTLKLSAGKATWPGPKQVWRRRGGLAAGPDVLATADEPGPWGAEPLLETVMEDGRRTRRAAPAEARERWARERGRLPAAIRALDATAGSPRVSPVLEGLRDRVAAAVGGGRAAAPSAPPQVDGGT